ncbi:LAQU0S12e03180g1_1 [Lachancea quebecensis]|uniref:Ureidoglycolate lyase n=1 Tax=Lachancea quebecensis TaxID=1654605 RepID=A0A0P1KV35_9SACH|nr:LAQU0S12e03180g1_1 [Lachancea quebecensis]
MKIPAQPLNIRDFSRFGSIVSPDEAVAGLDERARTANQGTAIKLMKVSAVENRFEEVREANWNLFRCFPAPHLRRRFISEIRPESRSESSVETVLHSIKVLEKHPFSSQTFLPMGRGREDVSYLVVVALADKSGEPDLSTLQAFTCKGTQAVTYGAGIWHAPMIVLGEPEFLDFGVLIHELLDPNRPEMDCVERGYKDGDISVVLQA